jgi:DNA (cytosine-5)-methyltransferase 1
MQLDSSNKSLKDLRQLCKDNNIVGYSNKNKQSLIDLINNQNTINQNTINQNTINNNNDNELNNKLKMIDLFAGTGAFTHAFENTKKVKCVFANDMNKYSKQIYDENFTHKLTLKDLNSINVNEIPSHDILTGGFPCQPFSIAGKQAGFQDSRSNVFWKILEIIDIHKPKCIILENVKNITSHDDGKTFKIIKKNLEDKGYFIKYKILDTSKFTGIPHHRERIYIVCIKNKLIYDKFNLDFIEKDKEKISTFLEPLDTIKTKYYYNNTSSTWNLLNANVKKKDTIYQYRRIYVRENKSGECPTLTANMGTGGHNVPIILDNKGIRKLTPRECFNFQGFPSTYKLPLMSDAQLYKLSGNAVSVPIVKLIADRLISLLIE